MESSRKQRVLAVGIDSAEPRLIRELIDQGELPTLGSLLERGAWALVDARADIGSGAVWPTFFTGTEPTEHGMYSGWLWKPDRMGCSAVDDGFFRAPFWNALSCRGESVGVVDVPFAPLGTITHGFELAEWGPHDVVRGSLRASPSRAAHIAGRERHPFYDLPYGPGYAEDLEGKRRLSSACLDGARARGELAARLISETRPTLSVIVFTEIHHTTHQLWHTVEPDHAHYATTGFDAWGDVGPGLVNLYREIDLQIGRIVDAAGAETAVMAFSLHGMRPGWGIPTILEPLLESLGFAAPRRWQGLSWRDRGAFLFGAAKHHAPATLRRLYHRRTSYRARHRLAQPTIVAPHDWSRTRAFSLPTDQRGYVRINVVGRERNGIVPVRDYEAVCGEIIQALRTVKSDDGQPLVQSVLRTAQDGEPLPRHLPDLIVDWADAAFARPTLVTSGSSEFESYPIRPEMTGQHARHGFCILDERLAESSVGEMIPGKDLHRLLLSAVRAEHAGAAG